MPNSLKTVLRIITSVLAGVLGVGLIYLLYTIVHEWILIIIPVVGIGVLFPIMMRHGLKTIQKERENVYAQLSHNMPVQYNTGTIFRGFAELLLLVWLIPIVPFVVAGDLWVAILPICTVVVLVVEALAANIWADIGWSKAKFWLMNIGFYIIAVIIGVVLNNLI